MKFIIVVILIGVAALSTGFSVKDHQRFRRQAPLSRAPTFPAGTQRTSDGVPILRETYRDSKVSSRDLPSNVDQHGLTLYEDFVNDPFVSTEDLESLITQKHGNRELRTGYQSAAANRDRVWSTRSGNTNWRGNGVRPAVRADRQSHPVDPVNGEAGNAWWEVSSRSGDHITYRRRGTGSSTADSNDRRSTQGGRRSEQYRADTERVPNWRANNAGVSSAGGASSRTDQQTHRSAALRSGSSRSSNFDSQVEEIGDANWVVASRGDDHITYRRRNQADSFTGRSQAQQLPHQSTTYTNNVQRLGRGEGEVLARVVNTAGSDEEDSAGKSGSFRTSNEARRRDGSHLASYRSMRRDYAHSGDDLSSSSRSGLQLKSGDYVSYKGESGSEAVYPRLRSNEAGRRYQRPEQQQTILPVTTPRSTPQEFEQQGNWRVVSKDNAHITWSRVGNDYVRYPTTARPRHQEWTQDSHSLRYQSVGSGPHYPMLLERETADRANRLGTSNGLRIAY